MIITRTIDANIPALTNALASIPGMIETISGQNFAQFSLTFSGERPTLDLEISFPDDLENEVNAVLDNHDPSLPTIDQEDSEWANESFIEMRSLPNWSAWTPAEAESTIRDMILNGMSKQDAADYITSNVTDLNSARQVLIYLAQELIGIREILIVVAKIIIHFRRIFIRRL